MVVNASLLAFEKRAREKVASAFRKIDGFGEVSSARCSTVFNSHSLKCEAIRDLDRLAFGRICMQIYIKLDDEGKECTHTDRIMMNKVLHSITASSALKRPRHGQVERFFSHAVRAVFALVKGDLDKDRLRSDLLGYIDRGCDGTERIWKSMDRFSNEELGIIKKSIEDDFFSKMNIE
jgi:hypothetical protein